MPLVYDWRAPVCGLFYDYDKGAAQFTAPSGVLTGEITKKKQYKIRHGKIIYILENDIQENTYIRFDIVGIEDDNIVLIKNAFGGI